MCEARVDSASEVQSRMRALDQTHVGMKIYQLNNSELSPNIFSLFFQFLNGSHYGRINNIYQYTETFNLINTTIKNIALNMGRIWRHPVLSQSEVVCTVAILEVQGDRPFSELSCSERACSVALNTPLVRISNSIQTQMWKKIIHESWANLPFKRKLYLRFLSNMGMWPGPFEKNFCSPIPWRLHLNFRFNRLSGF